ncbi:MAG: RHS repeat protein [Proteobacteria bacterium]|nr:RHS repeat protein [Pseudomonadota bacterium]
MEYYPDGLLKTFKDPKLNPTNFLYDSDGRLIEETDAKEATKTLMRTDGTPGDYTVDVTSGEQRLKVYSTETTDSGGRTRVVTFPSGMENTSVTEPDGSYEMVKSDGTQITAETLPDPRWEMAAPLYKITTTMPSGLKKEVENQRKLDPEDHGIYTFDRITEKTLENGKAFIREYDASARQWTNTTPVGRQSTVDLDEMGRLAKTEMTSIEPTNMAYDEYGRISEIKTGSEENGFRTKTFTYDERGYLWTETTISDNSEEPDLTVVYTRDDVGRVLTKTLPDGRAIHYTYDANGNVTSITPPGKPAHWFTYDELNLLDEYLPPEVNPGDDLTQYVYNADKQLDLIQRPDGKVMNYVYEGDADDTWSTGLKTERLSAISLPDGEVIEYEYDPITGNLASVSSPDPVDAVTLSYTYDGSLPLSSTLSGAVAGSVNQTYNNDFRVETRNVNGGHSVAFTYDDDGLLESVEDLDLILNPTTGQLTGTMLGNTSSSHAYTSFGETDVETYSHDGQELYSVDYTHDGYGRIKTRAETIEGQTTTYTYEYEELTGRLLKVYLNGDTDPIAEYGYGDNGNRLSYSNYRGATPVVNNGSYDDQDRMTSYGNVSDGYTTYTYSANGELETKSLNGENTIYVYDVLGNLRQVDLPDGTTIEYIVDGVGRRVGKKVNGALEQGFLYKDALNPIAELNGSGEIVSRFVYGTKANVPDYMFSKKADGSTWVTYRIISNHLGSPVLVVNADTGAVAQKIMYDEFGVVLTNTNAGFIPFSFAGGLHDVDTSLIRFGARDYDPVTGRWTAKDPIRFNGGDTNLYGYVLGDPVNFIDPNGEFIWIAAGGLIGGIVGGITGIATGEGFWKGAAIGAVTGLAISSGAALGMAAASAMGASTAAGLLGGSVTGGIFGFAAKGGIEAGVKGKTSLKSMSTAGVAGVCMPLVSSAAAFGMTSAGYEAIYGEIAKQAVNMSVMPVEMGVGIWASDSDY